MANPGSLYMFLTKSEEIGEGVNPCWNLEEELSVSQRRFHRIDRFGIGGRAPVAVEALLNNCLEDNLNMTSETQGIRA